MLPLPHRGNMVRQQCHNGAKMYCGSRCRIEWGWNPFTYGTVAAAAVASTQCEWLHLLQCNPIVAAKKNAAVAAPCERALKVYSHQASAPTAAAAANAGLWWRLGINPHPSSHSQASQCIPMEEPTCFLFARFRWLSYSWIEGKQGF